MAQTPSGGDTPLAQGAVRASDRAALNGLVDHVAAVEAARARLGEDLDKLTLEVRAQMSRRMEETAWKVIGTGGAILAGILARKALITIWTKSTRMPNPPTNPASHTTSWGEALAWTVASGVVVAVARLLAERGAAAGWQKAMGALPPGLEEVTA
jgi:hypothetical protein